MDNETLGNFRKRVERELHGDILPFWLRHSLDTRHGGFIGRMMNDRTVVENAPKGLILNARVLWTFSAVYRYDYDSRFLQLAQRAYEYLDRYFRDRDFGGVFWLLDSQGHGLDDMKKIYGQAFYLYALAEYYRATRLEPALRHAIEVFQLIEKHSHDDQYLGYYETLNRDWTPAEDSRLSGKDMNEKKSMNNHLHLLEAYTNLYRVWNGDLARERLLELIGIFQHQILDATHSHFQHFFDEHWVPKSSTYTFGHDIEGSWLLWEAAEVLGVEAIKAHVKDTILSLAEAVYQEGFDSDGGLFYEGKEGTIIDTNKEWWPQAEAVVGMINAYQLSGGEKYLLAALQCWDFIETRIVDQQRGEWFWRVSREGIVDDSQPKISEWKGPYHNTRACLEILHRLRSM
ncbi:MAG: AGE family epimerase/isomerase [bacterium]